MVEPFLTTKFLLPTTREDIIPRQNLIELLKQSLSNKLTIVSAPAGFGKTTLIGDWIKQQKISAAWLTLDENDNDPIRFLSYYLKALQTIVPDFGETILEILQAPQTQINEPLLTSLINEIAATFSVEFVFVLDDYHLVESPRINEIIAFILNHLPSLMHMVVATRSDPSLPVALLRGRGELLEFRQGDLRFTNEEAAEFLNQIKRLQLAPNQIEALTTRTEGWISGLQMAAISMQGRENISEFIQSFTGSDRYIFDYLIEEVLNRQPEKVQEFLLNTSILNRLHSDLCNAVMDKSDSQSILEFLERANLFIIPLDNNREWYRYHHLFSDLLRKELVKKSPEIINDLHQKASSWCHKAGYPEEAFTHALAAGDIVAAAKILERSFLAMMGRGELALSRKLFGRIPDEMIRSRPILSIQRAWILTLSGQVKEAEVLLQAIENLPSIEINKELSGNLAIIRALIATMRGDMDSAISLAQHADDLLLTDDLVIRGMLAYIYGIGYLATGNLNKAERACEQIKQFGLASNSLWAKTVAYHQLAQIEKLRGHLNEAQALCEEVLQNAVLRKAGRQGFLCGIYSELGDIMRERNNLESATKMVNKSLEISESWGVLTDIVSGNITLARIYLAKGDLDSAAKTINQAVKNSELGNIFQLVQGKLDACQVQIWLQQGNISNATRWANEIELKLDSFNTGKLIDFVSELELINLSRVWNTTDIMGGTTSNLEKSKQLLSRLAHSAEMGQRYYRLIEILVLQAIVFDQLGNEKEAFEALKRSILLAQPEGCMRIFLDEGQTMYNIVKKAQKAEIKIPYMRELLNAFDDQVEGLPESSRSSLPEELSDRELDVLRMLPTNLTAAEIADELFVAKSTIDTHIKHIYSKLGVNRRMEAIQRAKELDLL